VIAVTHPDHELAELSRRLRLADPPVIGYVDHGRLLLDLRTVDPADDGQIVTAIQNALGAA
jgi:L-seryl-tRNA(Ser) seleniumtransferase